MPTTQCTDTVTPPAPLTTELHRGVWWMQHKGVTYLEHDSGMVYVADYAQASWFIELVSGRGSIFDRDRVIRVTCSPRDPWAVAPSALLQGF